MLQTQSARQPICVSPPARHCGDDTTGSLSRARSGKIFRILISLPKSRKYELGRFQFLLKVHECCNLLWLGSLRQSSIGLLTKVLVKMSKVPAGQDSSSRLWHVQESRTVPMPSARDQATEAT